MIESKSAALFAVGSLVGAIGFTQADVALIAGGIGAIGWAGVSLYSRQRRQRIDDDAYQRQKSLEEDAIRRERFLADREAYLKDSREEIHRLRDELQAKESEKELLRRQLENEKDLLRQKLWETTRELDRWKKKTTPDPDRTQ